MSDDERSYTTWQDIKDAGPEAPERAFRRGYRNGWRMAIDAMHDLMFKEGFGRQSAYNAAWNHWHKALIDWVHRAEKDSEIEYPPDLGRQRGSDKTNER